jgi:hypothetical protein
MLRMQVTKSYVDNSVSNSYTQAEVDAIISEAIAGLQDQIDALASYIRLWNSYRPRWE